MRDVRELLAMLDMQYMKMWGRKSDYDRYFPISILPEQMVHILEQIVVTGESIPEAVMRMQ
ncbi:MAG: hypothetical protein K6F37_00525 [Lachnospiraceae bacterium]|nr:hypothetical protein [Lachnospiraceae bacterium]